MLKTLFKVNAYRVEVNHITTGAGQTEMTYHPMQEKKSKEMRVFQNRDILRSSHGTKYHS
jgi:hypothetical protein